MRVVLVVLFLVFVGLGSYFVGYEQSIKHDNFDALHALQEKFSKIDLHDDNLDLEKAIQEIKAARKMYPLDNKLKMIDIGLEHKKANQAYKKSVDAH